jgi:hypothetical protein
MMNWKRLASTTYGEETGGEEEQGKACDGWIGNDEGIWSEALEGKEL